MNEDLSGFLDFYIKNRIEEIRFIRILIFNLLILVGCNFSLYSLLSSLFPLSVPVGYLHLKETSPFSKDSEEAMLEAKKKSKVEIIKFANHKSVYENLAENLIEHYIRSMEEDSSEHDNEKRFLFIENNSSAEISTNHRQEINKRNYEKYTENIEKTTSIKLISIKFDTKNDCKAKFEALSKNTEGLIEKKVEEVYIRFILKGVEDKNYLDAKNFQFKVLDYKKL